MPFRPDKEEIQSLFLCKSIHTMSLELCLGLAVQIQQFRVAETPLLKIDHIAYTKLVGQVLKEFNLECLEHSQWTRQHLLALEAFFRKEVKNHREEQKVNLLDRLADQFFWSRIPLWRMREGVMEWHPLWFYWLRDHSLLVRDTLLLRICELSPVQDLAFLRNYKLF